jgi:mycofactocin biosynthetic radical S-adenosylmethionine protein MftC
VVDSKDNVHLLVWPDLGQWMAVDADLLSLIELCRENRTIGSVIAAYAQLSGRSYAAVEEEALPIMRELFTRSILTGDQEGATPDGRHGISNVTLNLTNKCNLDCSFCYNSRRNTGEMDIDRIMGRLRESAGIFDAHASFAILGGEPFLQPERILRAVDLANEIFLVTPPLVSTNGTLIGKRLAADVAKRRIEVQASIESHNPDINDADRGKGTFGKACRGIRALVDAGVYTIISMVMTEKNAQDLEGYLNFALKLGVNEARFVPLRLIGRARDHGCSSPDYGLTLDVLLDLLRTRPDFAQLLKRDYFSIQMAMARFSVRLTGCGVGSRVIFVDADGAVYPCPNHVGPSWVCGRLEESSLADIVRESPLLKDLRQRYEVGNYKRCRTCSFRCWCAGDCRGEILSVTGDPLAPSPRCKQISENFLKILWHLTNSGAVSAVERERVHGCA